MWTISFLLRRGVLLLSLFTELLPGGGDDMVVNKTVSSLTGCIAWAHFQKHSFPTEAGLKRRHAQS